MSEKRKAIVWFRRDLRLSDNPALAQAVAAGEGIIPFFVHDAEGERTWPDGAASKWWLHHSLKALDASLAALGSRLVIGQGESGQLLLDLCGRHKVSSVYWNRRYEPAIVERDLEVKKTLADAGIEVRSFNGSLLQSPLKVASKSGTPFKVFTPFWKRIRSRPRRGVMPRPEALESPSGFPRGVAIEALGLLPQTGWDSRFYEKWKPGEEGAREALDRFVDGGVGAYATNRDQPAERGASRLSPHLHFGEISPNQIWERLSLESHEAFLRQLGWREFAHHLLFHFPDTAEHPLRPEFRRFPWRRNAKRLEAWRTGRTGYPMVDAGMRELWQTGWMPNRLRMIVGSFLVKHLLAPWQEGAAWFWDTLVDADLANNTLGWQWVAGCGADAAPYFRIFNPITQGERFDPDGSYTRRWVPELKKLPNQYLFRPWEAPRDVLREAGVELDETYPRPIIGHKEGREAALKAYRKMRDAS